MADSEPHRKHLVDRDVEPINNSIPRQSTQSIFSRRFEVVSPAPPEGALMTKAMGGASVSELQRPSAPVLSEVEGTADG